jgi:UDP-GlcNAc:undecaprenyl-phosphate GlcNAc-1-phosphate transferase
MELMLGFLLAMSITMALIPPLMAVAARLRFLDAPSQRKVHSTPVPRVGGIAMATGTLIALTLSGEFMQPMPAYLAGVVVLLVFGVWDDRASLSAALKLLGQVIATLLVMSWGDVSISTTTLAERYLLPEWLSWPLTFMFILGTTNAINLADGLDGLAGGTTLLALCALALLALTTDTQFVGIVAIVIIGAILGFLRFNTHPARVFMGDGGSQILGFSAAVLAVVLTQNRATPLSSALPLLLLAIPLIDTLMVMTQRIIAGRSPLQADRNHIHHRLLALGFDHHEAVVVIYLLQGVLFISAWFLRYDSDLTIVAMFALTAALTIGSLHVATHTDWRWRHTSGATEAAHSRLGRWVRELKREDHLPRWALMAIAGATTGYFVAVAAVCPREGTDVRVMSALLAVSLALSLLLRRGSTSSAWMHKGALYLAVATAVYFDRSATTWLDLHGSWQVALFAVLVVAVLVRFRLASDRRFRITPLDVLVIFVAIVIPNLPGSIATAAILGESVAKLVALMYGAETLLAASPAWARVPSAAALVLLALCAVGGLA